MSQEEIKARRNAASQKTTRIRGSEKSKNDNEVMHNQIISADHFEPIERPVEFRWGDKPVALLKVDTVRLIRRGQVLISGWAFGDIGLGLIINEKKIFAEIERNSRPDVVQHLKISGKSDLLGFCISANVGDDRIKKKCALGVHVREQHIQGSFEFPIIFSEPDHQVRQTLAPVGYLEAAQVSAESGEAIVVGWEIHLPGDRVWLENSDHDIFEMDLISFRVDREDIRSVHPSYPSTVLTKTGFVGRITGVSPGDQIELVTEKNGSRKVLSAVIAPALPSSPIEAARWLFAINTSPIDFALRVPVVDQPVLDSLIQSEQRGWARLPLGIRQIGKALINPQVAVVIPLYGRFDFVEHQFIEFARDPWFLGHAELVYVVDDPKILEAFVVEAEALHRLYGVPFRWIWGGINRGFSGANNLGTKHSTAPNVLFLNSDCFPQAPGWLEQMVDTLDEHIDFAAIAPRLTHCDGSIQHAGMAFSRKEELGVWINHHPQMGLDPLLDTHTKFTEMSAITGACMLVRRSDLEAVGGWDTGYLIGDFEDSDLCLKFRNNGRKVGYLPSVQLTHLERQSFKLLGNGDFRQCVVIYNAVRHQGRWHALLEVNPEEVEELA